jgi:hypothetical protein
MTSTVASMYSAGVYHQRKSVRVSGLLDEEDMWLFGRRVSGW